MDIFKARSNLEILVQSGFQSVHSEEDRICSGAGISSDESEKISNIVLDSIATLAERLGDQESVSLAMRAIQVIDPETEAKMHSKLQDQLAIFVTKDLENQSLIPLKFRSKEC